MFRSSRHNARLMMSNTQPMRMFAAPTQPMRRSALMAPTPTLRQLAKPTAPRLYLSATPVKYFAATAPLHVWWNYKRENKMQIPLMGGANFRKDHRSLHRTYEKKFKKGHFPNRTRSHWNVNMNGIMKQRPRRMSWPFDLTTILMNTRMFQGSDKIGYVTHASTMLKTAVVAAQHLVYYPKYNQKVARTGRYFAHDEDMACVDGDLVHIKSCTKVSKYKHYYVFSIIEPNVEGRERLKHGLPAVAPPLFGYPNSRRMVKLNLTAPQHTKEKLAAALQEQVQDFYRYGGAITPGGVERAKAGDGSSFDEVADMIAPNQPSTGSLPSGSSSPQIDTAGNSFDELEADDRTKKGEHYYAKKIDDGAHDLRNLNRAP